MTLQQLQYFRVLAKVQHYTKASEQLFISQPTLSYAISELEKELQMPLFIKKGKKIQISRFGEAFLTYVEESLDKLDEGVKHVQHMVDPREGSIYLGYIYSLSSNLLPSIMQDFYKDPENKAIDIALTQNLNNYIMSDLVNGKVDLAFCTQTKDDFASVPILRQELYLIVPKTHPLAGRKSIRIEETKEEPYVLLNDHSGLRGMVDKVFKQKKIKPNIVMEVEECSAAITYVSMDFGISVIPTLPALDQRNVAVLRIENPEFNRTISMYWMEDRYMAPAVKKMRDFIIERYADPTLLKTMA
ncbi:LysR family transcriptional regulator [Fusibacter paucivorans]|uniref:LysR family transcriptional regulator n=1 Tax=Fusibacter paucivorans TaxID=76009 RepID=A0ABS5PKX7_9FIRM|nr:LysR family transcriptional regulator [Fusibacter paucivorans]MBS7525833.1 LysR family transcriptional regulator [Fusibacter paucivorans]